MTTASTPIQATNNSVPSPAFLTVDQVAQRLYVGRSTAYNMINAGEIPSIRFGRLIRIPLSALDAYLSNKLQANLPGN
jgi:excisionase family DNA binding protein